MDLTQLTHFEKSGLIRMAGQGTNSRTEGWEQGGQMGRQRLHKTLVPMSLLACEDSRRLEVDHNKVKVQEEAGGKVKGLEVGHDKVTALRMTLGQPESQHDSSLEGVNPPPTHSKPDHCSIRLFPTVTPQEFPTNVCLVRLSQSNNNMINKYLKKNTASCLFMQFLKR